MIDVRVLAVKPHPDQAVNNPGTWAVQFRVTHAGKRRSFWRWHTVRRFDVHGASVAPDNHQPASEEILLDFWENTFGELHGFDFEEDAS